MTAVGNGWITTRHGFPVQPCLYALEEIELYSKSDVLLWKLGRTKNLRQRIRGYPNPVTVHFVRPVDMDESLVDLERMLLADCPFPRCSGREWFRASHAEMDSWLRGGF